uniref:Uncharacterized protein n=1 Tax=Halamphora calidilacuna TaxID=2133758 RepID=A0A516ZBJ1_9STRA|nr:hypothetical protein [Halamphora calidilacuna]QDR25073.1 hypothetical protein [Halamphora calidilacuna]
MSRDGTSLSKTLGLYLEQRRSGLITKQKNFNRLIQRNSGVFQTEAGLKTGQLHYQGRFVLKGSRLGKKRLLEIFEKTFKITNLTLEPEILYESTKYCTKDETRKAGPFYVGTDSYRQKMMPMTIKLRQWQTELVQKIKIIENDNARDRKVFWIEDSNGGAGKSTFSKFLSFGQKD